MDRVAFVEILDRRGRVRERVRLESFPATIGRGYESDVILADRYVSPAHCRIVQDADSGAIAVEDLGSLNGLALASGSDGARRLDLVSGTRFRLGETSLRYVESTHPVAPAEPLARESGGVLHALRRRGLAVAVVGVALTAAVLEIVSSNYGETDVLGDGLIALGGPGAWAGGWAFVNHVLSQRFDYLRHLAWASLVALGFIAVEGLVEYLRFLFSADLLASVLDVAGSAGGLAVLLVGHLAIIPAATRRLRRRWALVLGVVVAGLLTAFLYTDEGFVDDLPFDIPLKSFGAEWAPADTTGGLLERARRSKRAVDALREAR